MFSARASHAVTRTGSPRRAIAKIDCAAAAAPAMSDFISSIFAGGLSEMPPESKVMPLPTSDRCVAAFWARTRSLPHRGPRVEPPPTPIRPPNPRERRVSSSSTSTVTLAFSRSPDPAWSTTACANEAGNRSSGGWFDEVAGARGCGGDRRGAIQSGLRGCRGDDRERRDRILVRAVGQVCGVAVRAEQCAGGDGLGGCRVRDGEGEADGVRLLQRAQGGARGTAQRLEVSGLSDSASSPIPASTTEVALKPVGAGIRTVEPAFPVWPTASAAAVSACACFFARPGAAGTPPVWFFWNATTSASTVSAAGSPVARASVGRGVLGVTIEGPSVSRMVSVPTLVRWESQVRARADRLRLRGQFPVFARLPCRVRADGCGACSPPQLHGPARTSIRAGTAGRVRRSAVGRDR